MVTYFAVLLKYTLIDPLCYDRECLIVHTGIKNIDIDEIKQLASMKNKYKINIKKTWP